MRFAALLLALVGAANAHYTFMSLILNGQVTREWQYVRRHTNGIEPYKGQDRAGLLRNDFRCNVGSGGSGPSTQVAVVAPGQRIGFKSYYHLIEHPGPLNVYMSKAPGNVQNYDGSGDWFKIHEESICGTFNDGLQDSDWCTHKRNEFMFTIPQNTPPGEYLVRIEHIALHQAHFNNPEFYFSCAQVRVTGSGTGNPGPTVKFPGAYNMNDPIWNYNIYIRQTSFPYRPGPPVWNGAAGNGGGNNNGGGNTTPPPTNGGGSGGSCAPLYGQCGGEGFNGAKCCAQGSCKVSNQWYSQCL